jgi:hypothetical protein
VAVIHLCMVDAQTNADITNMREFLKFICKPEGPCTHVMFQATHVKAQGLPILMQSQTDYCTVYVGCTGKLNTF